jgi:uroporphyrin-3 C-methyltransferase
MSSTVPVPPPDAPAEPPVQDAGPATPSVSTAEAPAEAPTEAASGAAPEVTSAAEPPSPVAPAAGAASQPDAPATAVNLRPALFGVGILAVAGVLSSALLWQKLTTIQEHLARQSADAGAQSIEARALAKQAQELSRETAGRQAVSETRLSEVALQRSQLDELMQSLSRSRDEDLVVDVEAALRLAQQQAQLTASVEPLLAALRSADQRIGRSAQPRLARVRAAIAHDIDRIRSIAVTDMPGLLARLDDLVRLADDLPAVNAAPQGLSSGVRRVPTAAPPTEWWQRAWRVVYDEVRDLVRVSRIEQPEAVLLSPEQTFFLRENLKLKLLNARIGLLARQPEAARADLASAAAVINKYFDPAGRKTQVAAGLLQQVQSQVKAVELPRLDETMGALATAGAGR